MTKLITPAEILKQKITEISSYVIEAFNEAIIAAASSSSSFVIVYQNDVIKRIIAKNPVLTRSNIFTNRWLDVEPIFRDAGWQVFYDKPAYNESYEPYWKFTGVKLS